MKPLVILVALLLAWGCAQHQESDQKFQARQAAATLYTSLTAGDAGRQPEW